MFKIIETSNTGILQTFGKFSRLLSPGWRFYIPIIQEINVISNRLKQENFTFEVKTKDNVFSKISLAVQYKIDQKNSEKAYFSLDNPVEQIDSYIENVVRARVPKMKLDELFESQDDICNSVISKLSEKMKYNGYTIENTLVTSIDPSKEVKDAMNKINASERLKEAAKNEADADYIKQVRKAEADRDRKALQGKGISLQRTEIMNGYDDSVSKLVNNFGLNPRDIINFVIKVQELDTMENIGKSNNTKILFMDKYSDQNKSSIISSLECKN